MAYTIKELARSESISPDGVRTTRVFDVTPWAARGEAYADLVGGVRFFGGRQVRVPPLSDPAYRPARVREIRCDPIEEDTLDGSVYGNSYNPLLRHAPYRGPARLTVTYATPSGDPGDPNGPNDPDTIDNASGNGSGDQEEVELATLSWDFSAQNLTLPNDRYGWQRADLPAEPPNELLQNEGVAATKTVPRFEVSLERKFVVRKPLNAICALLGRTNQGPLRVGFDTYPAETLRFDSASVRQSVTNLGVKFFNVTYKFTCLPVFDHADYDLTQQRFVGWNRLFDPRSGFWRRVVLASDPARQIHLFDQDYQQVLRGKAVKGFRCLFHPAAK